MTDIDLTKIDKPLGELEPEVAGSLLYAYYIDGKAVEFLCDGRWSDRGNRISQLLSLKCTYRLKPEPQTPDYVNWAMLPDWAQHVARDKDGGAFGRECLPILNGDYWQSGTSYCIRVDRFSDKLFKAGNLPWDQSLIERPKGE